MAISTGRNMMYDDRYELEQRFRQELDRRTRQIEDEYRGQMQAMQRQMASSEYPEESLKKSAPPKMNTKLLLTVKG